MLALSVRNGEGVWVGEAFLIFEKVPRADGADQFRLVIDAPKDVVILREKLKPRPGHIK